MRPRTRRDVALRLNRRVPMQRRAQRRAQSRPTGSEPPIRDRILLIRSHDAARGRDSL